MKTEDYYKGPVSPYHFAECLKRVGAELPPETVNVTIFVGVDRAIRVTYECNVLPEQLEKIAEAFKLMAEEAKQ